MVAALAHFCDYEGGDKVDLGEAGIASVRRQSCPVPQLRRRSRSRRCQRRGSRCAWRIAPVVLLAPAFRQQGQPASNAVSSLLLRPATGGGFFVVLLAAKTGERCHDCRPRMPAAVDRGIEGLRFIPQSKGRMCASNANGAEQHVG